QETAAVGHAHSCRVGRRDPRLPLEVERCRRLGLPFGEEAEGGDAPRRVRPVDPCVGEAGWPVEARRRIAPRIPPEVGDGAEGSPGQGRGRSGRVEGRRNATHVLPAGRPSNHARRDERAKKGHGGERDGNDRLTRSRPSEISNDARSNLPEKPEKLRTKLRTASGQRKSPAT